MIIVLILWREVFGGLGWVGEAWWSLDTSGKISESETTFNIIVLQIKRLNTKTNI